MGLHRLSVGLAPLWLGSLLSLAVPLPASGEEVTLPPHWRRQDGPGFVWDELACSSTQVFALHSQKGVSVHDGQRWTPLPPCPACRGAQRMAISPGGEAYLHTSQGVVVYWKGRWTRLDGADWQGPVHAMRVLESGLLVLVGEGRLGVRKGLRLVSRDTGTWRRLDAVSGLGVGNFWTVGQGGNPHAPHGWRLEANAAGRQALARGTPHGGGKRLGLGQAQWASRLPKPARLLGVDVPGAAGGA